MVQKYEKTPEPLAFRRAAVYNSKRMNARVLLLRRARESWLRAGRPRRLLAAVSGGADSMALLHVLALLSAAEGLALFVVHVDHGLRPDAGQDAALVEAEAARLGLFCRVCRVTVSGSGENAARIARYAALAQVYRDVSADALALAHHARDQAETVLLHLMRGSGATGLGAMAEVSAREADGMRLWRPFLTVSPDMLRAFLRAEGVLWREDKTNAQEKYLRNYVRHRVLPAMRLRAPACEEAIGRAAELLRQEDADMNAMAADFVRARASLAAPCRFILREPLRALPLSLQRRALRLASPVALDYEKTAALLAAQRGETVNLPGGWRSLTTEKRLHFLPQVAEPGAMGRVTLSAAGNDRGDGVWRQAVPKALAVGCTLRFRRPGDRIRPLGAPGEKTLQDYFVDKKIDRPFRDYIPLLCRGDRVIWAVGVGPGEEARVRAGEEAVMLVYHGALPDPWLGMK